MYTKRVVAVTLLYLKRGQRAAGLCTVPLWGASALLISMLLLVRNPEMTHALSIALDYFLGF